MTFSSLPLVWSMLTVWLRSVPRSCPSTGIGSLLAYLKGRERVREEGGIWREKKMGRQRD